MSGTLKRSLNDEYMLGTPGRSGVIVLTVAIDKMIVSPRRYLCRVCWSLIGAVIGSPIAAFTFDIDM